MLLFNYEKWINFKFQDSANSIFFVRKFAWIHTMILLFSRIENSLTSSRLHYWLLSIYYFGCGWIKSHKGFWNTQGLLRLILIKFIIYTITIAVTNLHTVNKISLYKIRDFPLSQYPSNLTKMLQKLCIQKRKHKKKKLYQSWFKTSCHSMLNGKRHQAVKRSFVTWTCQLCQ